jgi:hypothetical protein
MTGNEMITTQHDVDPTFVAVDVLEEPIKTTGAERIAPELLRAQAEVALQCLVPVDYTKVRGTCIDERERVGLLSGTTTVEARPSVPAGPDVYMLAILELTGYFPEDGTTGKQRLQVAKAKLDGARLLSGGHSHCAANVGFNTWMGVISNNPKAVGAYAQQEMGTSYDQEAMDEVVAYATAIVQSGRYEDWHEGILLEVLGDEAGEAIETLADVEHEAVKLARQKVPGMTIDQTKLYNRSVVGKGEFDMDDAYADTIEQVATSGPDAAWKKRLAEHAREAILAAVAQVVPNEELYEDIIHE